MQKDEVIYKWTRSAVECYERNRNCKGCIYDNFFSDKTQKCMMPQTVKYLLQKLGKPKNKNSLYWKYKKY